MTLTSSRFGAWLTYKKLFWIALVLHILTGWFSLGYHHPDEYYQILEFGAWKTGLPTNLPWEHKAQIRGALQPALVYLFLKAGLALDSFNPFYISAILRILSGLLGFWVGTLVVKSLSKYHNLNEKWTIAMFAATQLAWFAPYLHVRYSAENWSGIALALSLVLALKGEVKYPFAKWCTLGLLLGLSFWLRPQSAIAGMGLLAWILFVQKTKIIHFLPVILGGFIGIGVGAITDYWYYGEWVLSPYNYYDFNILQGRAADFGTAPAWFYLVDGFIRLLPPLRIVILGLWLYGLWKLKRHPITWIAIPFLLLHIIVSHKEYRFMFPLVYLFPAFAIISLYTLLNDKVWVQKLYNSIPRWIITFFLIINIGNLVFRTFFAPSADISAMRYIHTHAPQGANVHYTYCVWHPGTCIPGLFFQRRDLVHAIPTPGSEQDLKLNYWVTAKPGDSIPPNAVLKWASIPKFLLKSNFNHWQDRTFVWRVYEY